MAWALDLDGVVRLGPDPVAGAAEAVARLRAAGEAVGFVTNNSSHRRAEVVDELRRFGIEAAVDDVITSAMAVATLVEPGDRVLACAGSGVVEAIEERGAEVVGIEDRGAVDAVVVGFHRSFDYAAMDVAARAVRAGARLLASNDDATYPTPTGLSPGAGSILAGVATAAGRPADAIAGKPHPPMAALVRDLLGDDGWVVGDRPDTDGALATAMRWPFALVLSGVTGPEDVEGLVAPPALVAADLAEVVDRVLAG